MSRTQAEVCFHAGSVAVYVGKVAAAGKAIYPLPLYTNAALRDPIKPGAPGSYESGGPTDNVIPIWKFAAPALDIVSPDICMDSAAQYLKVLELYHRDDNPLFVPETSTGENVARFFFSTLGLQAIGFAPFGLDFTEPGHSDPGGAKSKEAFLEPTAQNYRLIAPMMRDIARLNFEGKLQAVAEEQGKPTLTLHFGAWDANVSYGISRNGRAMGNPVPSGRVLVAQLNANQFLVAGFHSRVDFSPADSQRRRQFLRLEEGTYEHGVFRFLRILNGDQTDWGLNFGSEPLVLRVSVAVY